MHLIAKRTVLADFEYSYNSVVFLHFEDSCSCFPFWGVCFFTCLDKHSHPMKQADLFPEASRSSGVGSKGC